MKKRYLISESLLKEFLHDSYKLAALEAGGVDNWEGYWESIDSYVKRQLNVLEVGDLGVYDLAERALPIYEDFLYDEEY